MNIIFFQVNFLKNMELELDKFKELRNETDF